MTATALRPAPPAPSRRPASSRPSPARRASSRPASPRLQRSVRVRPSALPPVSAATYRRRRLAAVALVTLALTVLLLLATRVGSAMAGLDGPPAPPEVYVVQDGDTLWSIAAEVAPGVDRREAVARLTDAAGGDALVPGQRIELPRYFD